MKKGLELKDQHIPSKLYHYKSLESDEKENYAFDEIETQTIYLASATQLNDLYDCVVYVDIDKTTEKLTDNRANEFITNFIPPEGAHPIPHEELVAAYNSVGWLENLRELILKYSPKEIHKSIDEVYEDLRLQLEAAEFDISRLAQERVVACCLTESNSNLPMWNHYADEYKGICIEYGMDKFPKESIYREKIFPIKYSRELVPDMTEYNLLYDKKYHPDMLKRIALHKHIDWEYEREWRFAFDIEMCKQATQDMFDNKMKLPCISAVYMGKDISAQHKECLLNITNKMKMPLFYMKFGLKGIEFIREQ